jgi:hypothetical protein
LAVGLPVRNLLPIGEGIVEDIYRASPDMELQKASEVPASLGEEFMRREAGLCSVWCVLVYENSLLYSHRPETGIVHVRPVNF